MRSLLPLLLLAAPVVAESPPDLRTRKTGSDWPTFLGPNQDGVSSETGILKSWPAGGLKDEYWERCSFSLRPCHWSRQPMLETTLRSRILRSLPPAVRKEEDASSKPPDPLGPIPSICKNC